MRVLELIQGIDETALRWIADHLHAEWLDPLMKGYTSLGNGGWVFIAASIALLLLRRTRRAGATSLSAMLLGLLVTNLTVKPLVGRLRPWIVMERFTALVTSGDPNSFPSGHTCAAFAFAAALSSALPQRWAKAAAWSAAALMGFSRLYVGVHFPTDVLAGAMIGLLCGLAAGWLSRKTFKWLDDRKAVG